MSNLKFICNTNLQKTNRIHSQIQTFFNIKNMKNETNLQKNEECMNQLMKVNSYSLGAYTIDVQKRLLIINGEVTKLTTKESELLVLFAANANEIIERRYALKMIWEDDNYYNARSMDVYICKLRKLLNKDSNIYIINIHGKGYKLMVPA